MELRHLRYFIAVAEELHFGRAAARLNTSQPPLSQQIAALERDLGVTLLERSGRRVALTDAGRLLLQEARATLEQAARTRLVATRAKLGQVGELRIGLFASAPLSLPFARALGAFRRECPDVTLTLQEQPTPEQIDELLRGRLEFGFLRSPGRPQLPPDLDTLEVVREPLCVALPPDHALAAEGGPLPIAELAEEPLVFFSRSVGSSLNDQLQSLCMAAGFVPRITQEAAANSMILGLVAAGLGISVLPSALCSLWPDRIRVRPLDAPGAVTFTWLAWRRDRESPLTRCFVAQFRGAAVQDRCPTVP
jgi:DNA-binding transcriptional LysR family regulator